MPLRLPTNISQRYSRVGNYKFSGLASTEFLTENQPSHYCDETHSDQPKQILKHRFNKRKNMRKPQGLGRPNKSSARKIDKSFTNQPWNALDTAGERRGGCVCVKLLTGWNVTVAKASKQQQARTTAWPLTKTTRKQTTATIILFLGARKSHLIHASWGRANGTTMAEEMPVVK